MSNAISNPTSVKEVSKFGNGRYSPLMEEIYSDAMAIFKLDETKAEKLANSIGSELGAIMRNVPTSVTAGKLNKDGKLTISEAAKLKGFTVTNNILCLRALQWANEAMKNGFNRNKTDWEVIPALAEYFDTL